MKDTMRVALAESFVKETDSTILATMISHSVTTMTKESSFELKVGV